MYISKILYNFKQPYILSNSQVKKGGTINHVGRLTSLTAGLAAGATGLNGELLASGLQLVNALLGPAWEKISMG